MSKFTYTDYLEEEKNTICSEIKTYAIQIYGDTKNYEIERNLYFDTLEDALETAKKLYDRINYMLNYSKKKDRYKNVSCFIGVSIKDGKTARKIKEKTKGRPKHNIIGIDKKPHLHILVLGNNASKFCSDIIKKLNYYNDRKILNELKNRFKYKENTEIKKLLLYKKKPLKKENNNGVYYLSYIYRQSVKIYSTGYFKNNYGNFFISKNF